MRKKKIDPDRGRRDDSSYWAAALVLAIKTGNRRNEMSAREHLRRLGFDIVTAEQLSTPEAESKGGAE